MKEIQRILSHVRRAVADYDMIQEGDRVCVGVSAGKDSLTLLIALAALRRFYEKKYTLCAATVDLGFEGADSSEIAELCRRLDIEYKVVPTQIGKVVFDIRKENNPCSLCAKMRRGALHAAAKEMGCNRVALGHHFDDTIETFMLNLFFEGRIGCFSPVSYLSNTELYLINTERENMKQLLRQLEKDNKGLRHRIFGAIQRGNVDGFKEVGRLPNDD